jgi:hypothetical protein
MFVCMSTDSDGFFNRINGEWRALPPVPVLVGILDGLVADPEGDKDDEQQDDEIEHVLHHPVHHRHHRTEIFTAKTIRYYNQTHNPKKRHKEFKVEHLLHHPIHHRHHGTEIFTAQTLGITVRQTTLRKGIRRSK